MAVDVSALRNNSSVTKTNRAGMSPDTIIPMMEFGGLSLEDQVKLKSNFTLFLAYAFRFLGFSGITQSQMVVAEFLGNPENRQNRYIIEAFRGIGKSFILSVFVVWRLLKNPKETILVVSATADKSTVFLSMTRKLLNIIPLCITLIPEDDMADNSTSFDVPGKNINQSHSVTAKSITGQITGSRATLIVSDDVEISTNSATQSQRDKLLKLVGEFDSILEKNNPNTEICYLGTPQTQNSIYNILAKKSNYSRIIIPAMYPSSIEQYNGDLAKFIVDNLRNGTKSPGDVVDLKRTTEFELINTRISQGISQFELQFMLNTSDSDDLKYPLKLSDLLVTYLNEYNAPISITYSKSVRFDKLENDDERLENIGFQNDCIYKAQVDYSTSKPYDVVIAAIDPSGTGKDETTMCILGYSLGRFYLLNSYKTLSTGYSEEVLIQICSLCKQFNVTKCIVEDNFGDGMYSKSLKSISNKVYPMSIESKKHTTQKESRIIDTLEPVMNAHRLVVSYEVIRNDIKDALESNFSEDSEEFSIAYSLFYQLTHITKEKNALSHDDRLDALALGIWFLKHLMELDAEVESRLETERLQKIQHELVMSGALMIKNPNLREEILESYRYDSSGSILKSRNEYIER